MRSIVVPVVVLAASAWACAGGAGTGDDVGDGFVTSRLEQVPAAIGAGDVGTLEVTMLDVVQLAERRGLDLPSATRTGEELASWINALAFSVPGGEPLIGIYPTIVEERVLPGDAEFTAATGIAPGAIESIVTARVMGNSFTVLTGVAVGESLPEVADGVQAYGAGDDFELDPTTTTSWNALGQPFRFATRDGAVAVARSTPVAAAWLAGAVVSLADDPALGPLARALDEYGTFSAFIVKDSFAATPPPRATPAEVEAYMANVPDVAPFTAIGSGVTVVDDKPRTIVAYVFADADAASAALGPLAEAWRVAVDPIMGPIADLTEVLATTSIDEVAVIELAPVGDGTTQDPGTFLYSAVFQHP